MLATLTDAPFSDDNWLYEIKWDGYRAIAYINQGKVELRSRADISFTEKYAPVTQALQAWETNAVIDGEIVTVDEHGLARFQLLQTWNRDGEGTLVYYVFDLLWLNGHDLTDMPLTERKALLQALIPAEGPVRYSEHIAGKGEDFFEAAKAQGLEGIMAKRADSAYHMNFRSGDWLKIKTTFRQEVVIAGYTEPRNSRQYFGALVLGVYNPEGKLVYVGHTGSGFNEKSLADMWKKLQPLVTSTCPFENKPKTNMPATWVKPKLVGEIKFQEWTRDGSARQPIFMGLRDDKKPTEVMKEKSIHRESGKKGAEKEKESEKASVRKESGKKRAEKESERVNVKKGSERAGSGKKRAEKESERAGSEKKRAGKESESAGSEKKRAGKESESAGSEKKRAGKESESASVRKESGKKRAESESVNVKKGSERAGSEKKSESVKKGSGKRESGKKKAVQAPILTGGEKEMLLKVNKQEIQLTNLTKPYWKKEKYTKRDLINYYHRVAPFILPYMVNRPQSMNRHPDGADGKSFFQKDVTGKVPAWIDTHIDFSESTGENIQYLVCNNEATLLYMANLGCIELNPWHSRTQSPDNPDYCIIDLDPEGIGFDKVIEAALVIKDILDDLGADAYCKTSGATGMHIYIPLGAKYTYDQSKQLAQLIVTLAHQEMQSFTSLERSPSKRPNKIYLDFLQNRQGQTIAAPYSLRPRPGATVATPLHWDEVKKGLTPADFHLGNILDRLATQGDIFGAVLGKGVDVMKVLSRLAEKEQA